MQANPLPIDSILRPRSLTDQSLSGFDAGLLTAMIGTRERGAARGFSLIELLVVLVLIGFMAGVAGPAVGRFLDAMEFKRQTGKVMAAVRYARLKAITEGQLVLMTASDEDWPKTLVLTGGVNEVRELELAEGATLELEPLQLGFSPEGYATPGLITLTSEGRTESIFIDPLTGIPLLEDPDHE